MGLMGPMRLMGMRKEATRAGMSTERLKSGAAKSLEKTAPRARRDPPPLRFGAALR